MKSQTELFFILPSMIAWAKWTLFHCIFQLRRNLLRSQWTFVWMMWSVTKFSMPPWQTSLMLIQTPYFGTKKLSQVLPKREDFALNMPCALDDATDAWGTEIECEEIRNANCATLKSHRLRSTSVPQNPRQGWWAQKETAASWALNKASVVGI